MPTHKLSIPRPDQYLTYKLIPLVPLVEEINPGRFWFDCPGCKSKHLVNTNKSDKPCWEFNGNIYAPTFKPSILTYVPWPDGTREVLCHSFVTNGKIRFLKDSPHHLAGKTVDLSPSH